MLDYGNYSLKYSPLLRLLESWQQDREFLQQQPGYSREIGRTYDAVRRAAILAYLRALEEDWKGLYRDALPLWFE